MDAMKLLLSLIVLHCLCSSPAETASAFRYYNPFSWFSSSANRTKSPLPSEHKPDNANLQNNMPASIVAQNASNESISDSALDPLRHGDMQSSPVLAVTPLEIKPLGIRDNETADIIEVLVPTRVAPLLSSQASGSVKRFGLIRETEVPEGREEIESQTTTVTATPELRKEDPDKKSADVKTTSTAKPTPPSITGPEAPETTRFSTTSDATTPSSSGSAAAEPSLQTDKLQGQDNRDEIIAATTDPSASITTTTRTSSMESELETSSVPLPDYVSSEPQQNINLRLTEDFVRFLNSRYYEQPLFNDVAAAGLR